MIAKTDSEKARCYEYLRSKGLNPLANIYVYTEKDEKIVACCGIVFVGMIEPFASDDKIEGLKLFGFAQGLIAQKVEFVGAMTNKEEVKSILLKDNFHKWGLDNSDIFIK